MAETIRGINVVIGAETSGLSAALKDVDKKSKDITSELRQVENLLKFNPKDTELLAQKQKLLSDRVANTSEKLDRLKEVQEQVNEQFKKGEISEQQHRAFQRELIKTESQLEQYKNQLNEASKANNNLSSKLKEVSNSLQQSGEKLKSIGSAMSVRFTAPIVAGFGLVTKGTEEFRQDLARLETNAQQAGIGADAISASLTRLSGISDETDSNVEALSNLLATGFDEQGMATALDALSGAVIKFPDTLKIEGLADGLQETLATGAAVGPFSELLERMGMDLDTFNEGLASATANGEQQNFILQTLASTGLAEVNQAYRENNKELVESKEAQSELQQALADLGTTVAPIVTSVTGVVGDLVAKFNEMSPTAKSVALAAAGIAAAVGPALVITGQMTTGVGSLLTGFGKMAGFIKTSLIPAITGISAPMLITIAAVATFAALAYEVYRNWTEVKNAWVSMLGYIGANAAQISLNVQMAFEKMKMSTLSAIDAMLEKLSVLENLPFGIGESFAGLRDSVTESTLQSGLKIMSLATESAENAKRIAAATAGMAVGWSDLGTAVANDVKGVITAITGQTSAVKAAELEQTETISAEQKKQTDATVTGNENRTDTTKTNEQEQTDIVDKEDEKRTELRKQYEQSWNDKLFQLTATRLEKLEAEKRDALANAEELGASKSDILAYYATKEQEIIDERNAEAERKRQEEAEKELQAQQQKEQIEQSWTDKLFQQTATRAEILEAEKQAALAKAEELGLDKTAILQYYANEEKRIANELSEEQANAVMRTAEAWTDSYMSMVDAVVSGSKSIGEALKEMVIQFFSAKEKEVLLAHFAELAKAFAQSWWDWSAVARAGVAIARSTAAFEGAKAVVNALADGALVTGPTMALVGEGRDEEAVIPLNPNVLAQIGASIAANMPAVQPVAAATTMRPVEVHLHVGTMVADKFGLKQLERQLQSIRLEENLRLGMV